MTHAKHDITETFRKQFNDDPKWVVRGPGRVNLIGEHTDYNGGFVMPMAIDRATWIALSPIPENKVEFYAIDHNETLTVELGPQTKGTGWGEYVKGVTWALQEAGYALKGWRAVSSCDVPMGAGLSSSASLELAVAKAFSLASGFDWDAPAMALLGQKAENEWVGVNCGIMDQMISATGQEGKAILIDCRSLDFKAAPLPENSAVVILDTSTRRGLVDSAYNERRAQCEEAARFFGVDLLRDVSLDEFNKRAEALPEMTRRRARHVISENERTVQASEAMDAGDAKLLGALMNASHDSLRDDFEVTNEALNTIVDCARAHTACIGARMTGAGFGGCAVALIEAQATDDFLASVKAAYENASGLTPSLYVCQPSNGAEAV